VQDLPDMMVFDLDGALELHTRDEAGKVGALGFVK
jgi:hypothetical protein